MLPMPRSDAEAANVLDPPAAFDAVVALNICT
jgi:hypothetical protein